MVHDVEIGAFVLPIEQRAAAQPPATPLWLQPNPPSCTLNLLLGGPSSLSKQSVRAQLGALHPLLHCCCQPWQPGRQTAAVCACCDCLRSTATCIMGCSMWCARVGPPTLSRQVVVGMGLGSCVGVLSTLPCGSSAASSACAMCVRVSVLVLCSSMCRRFTRMSDQPRLACVCVCQTARALTCG